MVLDAGRIVSPLHCQLLLANDIGRSSTMLLLYSYLRVVHSWPWWTGVVTGMLCARWFQSRELLCDLSIRTQWSYLDVTAIPTQTIAFS